MPPDRPGTASEMEDSAPTTDFDQEGRRTLPDSTGRIALQHPANTGRDEEG